MKYAFVLGRNHELSVAELGAFFGARVAVNKPAEVAFVEGPLETSSGFSAEVFLARLGGTTEILEVISENGSAAKIEEVIFLYLEKACAGKEGKCGFAINLFPERKESKLLRHLLTTLKKKLRAGGVKANFLNNNFQNVSSVYAAAQGLAQNKTNLHILDVGEGMVTIGATVAFQNVDAYSKRDYGKPMRDAKVGMLPPKLAQVMVNLSRSEGRELATIIDPFCGSGTVLMEAMLAGHSVVGGDVDPKMVAGAEKNVAWLPGAFKIPRGVTSEIFKSDAVEFTMDKKSLPGEKCAIVTEPHLGPPLLRLPLPAILDKNIAQLSALYLAFFKNLASWVPQGTPVVFIFPYFKGTGETKIRMSEAIIDKIEALGYSKTTFDPLHVTSLFYERPDQLVGREIVRLVKT